MAHTLLIAQTLDSTNTALLQAKEAATRTGNTLEIITLGAAAADVPEDGVRNLHSRALGTLILISQLIIAAVIAGYFLRFYPVVMTVIFWGLIVSMLAVSSRFLKPQRLALLNHLTRFWLSIETSKHAYEAVYAGDAESLPAARMVAEKHNADLVSPLTD